MLLSAAEVPRSQCSPLTAVRNAEEWGRLIMDGRARNAREAPLGHSSQELTPGWRLTDIP
eukprot:13047312-Alexandrium_andersonii.AAC.1